MPKPKGKRPEFPRYVVGKTRRPKAPICKACNDTGHDSRGRPCHPCLMNGRVK